MFQSTNQAVIIQKITLLIGKQNVNMDRLTEIYTHLTKKKEARIMRDESQKMDWTNKNMAVNTQNWNFTNSKVEFYQNQIKHEKANTREKGLIISTNDRDFINKNIYIPQKPGQRLWVYQPNIGIPQKGQPRGKNVELASKRIEHENMEDMVQKCTNYTEDGCEILHQLIDGSHDL